MFNFSEKMKLKDSNLMYPDPLQLQSPFSTPYNSSHYEKNSTPLSSFSKISPILILVIVILAVIFFIAGALHLFVKMFLKTPSSSSSYQSNRYTETSNSHSLQRQLQQLFRLHDSGLDQPFIDSLPVFYYKDIMGLREPFDCAVCLCSFSDQDRLRLIPICSHAFHINCIDTWLLSNSTCPLCRATLLGSSSNFPLENPIFNFEDFTRSGFSGADKEVTMEEGFGERRVFWVRLGKFRSLNSGEESGEKGESSKYDLNSRRCYSMGTFQYIVGDSNLQVVLSNNRLCAKEKVYNGDFQVRGDLEGKKISNRSRGESLSVSKIWLWSKKSKFPSSSGTLTDMPASMNVISSVNFET